MRVVTDILLLIWLCAAVLAGLFAWRPNPTLAPFSTRGRALVALAVILVVGVAAIALLGLANRSPSPAVKPPPVRKPAAALPSGEAVRAHPERYLVLSDISNYHGRDDAVVLTGAVTNMSGLPLADPRLTCRMAKGEADAGTVSAVIHASVPVGSKLIFAAINLGRADGAWDRQTCVISAAAVGN